MKNLLRSTLLILVAANSFAQSVATRDFKTEDIYRHYVGTINGQRVMLDLRFGVKGGSNYGGSWCYFLDKSYTRRILIGEPQADDTLLEAVELPQFMNIDDDHFELGPKWKFKVANGKLTGKWYTRDKKESAIIDLKEDYSNAYAMRLERTQVDTGFVQKPERFKIAYRLFVPFPTNDNSKNDNDVIGRFLLKLFRADTLGITDWNKYPREYLARLIKGLTRKAANVNMPGNTTDHAFGNFACVYPAYNHDGLISFEVSKSLLGDDPNDKNLNFHYCLDVKLKREWTLGDILKIDTPALSNILEKEFRLKYQLSDKSLQPKLWVDKIPVTGNVIVSNRGLEFCYHNHTISPAEDELSVYIPYSMLSGMLRKEFKTRMKL